MSLEGERGYVGTRNALQRAIEERHMGAQQVRRQAVHVDRKTVVLAGDQHLSGLQILHRMVGTMVPELHFQRPRARGQRQQLVTETDAEDRHAPGKQLANRVDRVVAGLRVARTVRQEHPVGPQREDIGSARLRRHDGHPAAAGSQHAQDVVLDAVVVGDDVQHGRRCIAVTAEIPGATGPRIGCRHTDDAGQIHSRQARESPRFLQCTPFVDRHRHDAAGLRSLLAQDAGQLARIDPADGNDSVLLQVVRQCLLQTPAGGPRWQVTDDQTGGVVRPRLEVFRIAADIADMRIGQRDDLAAIRGIGKDFLITRHRRIEDDFAAGAARSTDRQTPEDRAVSQGENRRRQIG